jgi:cytochrome c-type biogenesis protein CcmH/NrfG
VLNEVRQARVLVQQLSELERDALMGLVDGSQCWTGAPTIHRHRTSQEILDRMKRKLRVTRAASAVWIRLIASASL